MFVLTAVKDTIKIPPNRLSISTLQAIHNEIDYKYPNRILMDVGLVIARAGDCDVIQHGVCVPGEGGSHHKCQFRLVVFRPFVDEVILGRIVRSTPEGIHISIGFFENIFVPAYWMLNPSRYEEKSGLWVWTPQYDEEDAEKAEKEEDGDVGTSIVKTEEDGNSHDEEEGENNGGSDENRYEMELGAEIRFKVKSIHFAQITNTAKGMQATMTTTSAGTSTSSHKRSSSGGTGSPEEIPLPSQVRRRSSSVGLDESHQLPPPMHIVASICEDGLGLTSWWTNQDEGDEGEEFEE